MAYINGKEILLSPQVNINNEGIPPGYVKPKGQLNVTENGVYPVPECAFVDVNVATREPQLQRKEATPSAVKNEVIEPDPGFYLEAVEVKKIPIKNRTDVPVTEDGQVINAENGYYMTSVTLSILGELTIDDGYINEHNKETIDVSNVSKLFLNVDSVGQGGETRTLTINMDYLYNHLEQTIPLDDYTEIKIDISLADLEWGA